MRKLEKSKTLPAIVQYTKDYQRITQVSFFFLFFFTIYNTVWHFVKINSDLPDLSEISGVMRETSNRVEHIMSQARSSNAPELQRSHTSLH